MYLLSALFSSFFSTLAPLHKIISVNWRFFKPKAKKKPFRVKEQITWKIVVLGEIWLRMVEFTRTIFLCDFYGQKMLEAEYNIFL